jgi:hypothetical protein
MSISASPARIELGENRLLTLEEGLVDGPSVLLGNKHFE